MDQSFVSDGPVSGDRGRGVGGNDLGDDDDDEEEEVDASPSDRRARAAVEDTEDVLSTKNDISLLDFLRVAFSTDRQDGSFQTNAKLGDIISGIYQSEFRDYSLGSVFELYKNNAKRRRCDGSFDGNDCNEPPGRVDRAAEGLLFMS